MAHQGRKNADHLLLLALACGMTVENAADTAHISRRTAHRRLNDAEFAKRLEELRKDMVERTSAMITAAGPEAVKTLRNLLDASNGGAIRLGAARALLELGVRLRDLVVVEERLAALEERISATQSTSKYPRLAG